MARAEIKLPNKFIDSLEKASNEIHSIAGDALKAGAAVVEPRMRTNLTGAIGRTKRPTESTGQLLSALGTSPVGVTGRGTINVKVGFAENRSDGIPHAKIATVLEYGSSRQAARPFLAPTRAQTRSSAVAAMKETLTTKLEGLDK
ncbi:HK97-gp10 family putative phage morphogenesis protein [Trueperella pyogenes]|uniref:HK97-gp10 family putative phage morphogenesis protein n=1 Tax=Trueperella pyogenes TaxID=1661 RepID=UPI0014328DE8|nr:HK97-gp10 family putative phage morphogenesis protein [Trueperella pyogenes]QIU87401.1 HK97 gp10 family phage protein [Trueperella pyogenes]